MDSGSSELATAKSIFVERDGECANLVNSIEREIGKEEGGENGAVTNSIDTS